MRNLKCWLTSSESLKTEVKREKARRGLIPFTEYTYSKYRAEPAHEFIAAQLERILRGDIDRLMIFAPPQHGKSELASVRFPAFWLGHNPDQPVILTSYAASLAYKFSKQGRDLLESAEYQELFPDVRTDKSSRSRQQWNLDGANGGLIAAGVGGAITGHGAKLGIIDDPFENWEQAYSETIRDKVWNWWQATFRTRIWEGGSILLIMTRWHEDDLAGRLLRSQGDKWTVVRLPAIAETEEEREDACRRLGIANVGDPLGRGAGEALCPDRFSYEALLRLKEDVGTVSWYSEYQGTPRAPMGNRFKRSWFEIVDSVPAKAKRVRYWDKAGTSGSGNYSVGVLMAQSQGIYYVEDVVRGQWSALEREETILRTAERDGKDIPIWTEQEPGSGGKESAEATVRMLAGFNVYLDRVTGSKEIRAEPFAVQCEAGSVKLRRADWNAEYLDELSSFPTGMNDDQVDASSGAFNKLADVQKVAGWGW